MNKYKKIIQKILIGIAILAIFLTVLVLAAPRLINLESVRKMIITEVSSKIGGQINFQKIKLSFLPWPHAVVYQGRLSVPDKVDGNLESLSVYLKIKPLLTGNIQISKILLERPEFKIIFPEIGKEKKGIQKKSSDIDIEEKIAAAIGIFTSISADLEVIVEKGRLNISTKRMAELRFEDIDIRLDLLTDRVNLNFKARSNLFEGFILKGGIDLKTYSSWGDINMSGFRPQLLTEHLVPADIISIGDSIISLGLKFETDRSGIIKGEFRSPQLRLALQRGGAEVILKGKGLKGAFHKDNERVEISLKELNLENPKLKLSGKFLMDPAARKVELKLNGRDVDVGSARQFALALAGDISTVKDIFDILKGGNVPGITFATGGKSIDALGELESIYIKGNIRNGSIRVPEVNLEVNDVKSEVLISKGILEVINIQARYGDTQVRDGILRLGLSGKNAPFHLDISLLADISQVPEILKQVIDDKRIVAEIDRISAVRGRADGRLILGERLDSITATVKLNDFNLSAEVKSLPYLLELKGSGFSYAGKSIEIQALTSQMKNSNLTLSSARMNWKKTPFIAIRSEKASINLKELYAWLVSVESLAEPLKRLKALDGTVKLLTLKLNGPLLKPSQWNFDVAGRMANINLKADILPELLSIKSVKFTLTPQVAAFADVEADSMDASLKLAGRLNGYLEGVKSLDITLNGHVGEKASQWLLKQVKIPPHLLIRPPLVVSNGHFTWDRRGTTTISGDLSIHNDLNLSAEIFLEPHKIYIKKFVIQDKNSQALFALNLHEKEINFNFKGNLQKATVDKLLADNQILSGWIKGDLRLNYFKDRPMDSLFEGQLRGKDLILFRQFNFPVQVNSFSIEGWKDKFHLESDLRLQSDKHLKLKGDVNYSSKGVVFDASLTSDGIELDRLAARLDGDKKGKEKRKKEKFYDLPIEGILKLDLTYLKYKQYDMRPFHADISLHPEKITITVSDTNLCGISTPGTLTLYPQEIQLNFKPMAQNQEFQSAVSCLIDKEVKLEGKFNLSGEITGRGPTEDLMKSLQGNFELNATKGRFLAGRSYRTLRDILALINVTEVYKGKLPDLTREGFGYNSIRAKVSIKNDILVLKEGFIDGLTMNIAGHGEINFTDKSINLTALVAPLKTVDSIIRKIPLVGYILGGSLITVPVSVIGDFNQPKVSLLAPAAVGEGLVGMMKRTLELPIKIMEPVIKGEKK